MGDGVGWLGGRFQQNIYLHNSTLTYEDMADLRIQGISVDNNNDPAPKNIHVPENIPLPQLE